MNFQQAEQFLTSLSNLPRAQYMSDPKRSDVYIKRVQAFLDLIGNPEKKIPHYIHIAGTSGKGSTSSFIHSILVADKKFVGLYVSPHPTHIIERWKYGNKYMTESEFVEVVSVIKKAFDTYIRTIKLDPPSFFEIATAMTLYWFAQKGAEWAVIETGCGGRLDSTNVLPYKDIAIITNVGLDHMEILGDTKEKIAYEKAGIIKKNCIAITQEQNKKVRAVIEKEAKKQKVALQLSKPQHTVVYSGLEGSDFIYKDNYFHIKSIGTHQIKNAILAIDAARLLHISEEAIHIGVHEAKHPVCMEIIQTSPHVILDGAHNPDKIKTTVNTLNTLLDEPSEHFRSVHLILAFSGNKDIRSMIKLLMTLGPKTVICTRNTVNPFRKVGHPGMVAQLCKTYAPKAKIELYLDPEEAFEHAKRTAKQNDIILVTGSLFMSGQLRHG